MAIFLIYPDRHQKRSIFNKYVPTAQSAGGETSTNTSATALHSFIIVYGEYGEIPFVILRPKVMRIPFGDLWVID